MSDGKLYQEKVQSIMYLRHSSSGGKSISSSVVSLSPTVFTDTPHEGTTAYKRFILTAALNGSLYISLILFSLLYVSFYCPPQFYHDKPVVSP